MNGHICQAAIEVFDENSKSVSGFGIGGTTPLSCHRLCESYFLPISEAFWILSGVLEYVPDSCSWQKSELLSMVVYTCNPST
jgi:hypothetical protein